jgi:hypothetical protein
VIVFGEMDDGVVDAELADERTLVFGRITDVPEDAEEIQAGNSVLVTELLHCAGEDVGDGERCRNRRRETNELLKGLEHILKIGLRELG